MCSAEVLKKRPAELYEQTLSVVETIDSTKDGDTEPASHPSSVSCSRLLRSLFLSCGMSEVLGVPRGFPSFASCGNTKISMKPSQFSRLLRTM